MSSIHAVRASKWETNSFLAEWFANAVVYCQSREGKQAFEAWLVQEYGREKAKQKLLDCQKPPRKIYGLKGLGNRKLFNSAAVEFGISDDAMQEYHLFTAGSNLCVPPRIKPAPKRRRGETSTEWLARRHDALLAGCKVPDIDWRIARAVAISEFDKARDTFEIWHTDIKGFLDGMLARAPTTLINPEIKVGTPEERIYRLDYAFRAGLHAVTLSYMTWGHAVDLFEEFDRRGLTTTSAIERAYKQDSALMWNLVACLCKISYLAGHLWERFTEIMSWSEYYRPYFKRYRTLGGSSRVEINRAYIKQRGGYATLLDNVIIEAIDTDAISPGHSAFFDNVMKCLNENPAEANKFSNEAYEEMGDNAIVKEFKAQMYDSAFGQRLMEYATAKDPQCLKDPTFLPSTTFIDPSKIQWVGRNSNDWAYARTISRSVGSTWLATTNRMSMADFFIRCIPGRPEKLPFIFDSVWRLIDTTLWEFSKALDRRGDLGTVARKFGLFDPADPERPSCMRALLKQSGAYMTERMRLSSAPGRAGEPSGSSTQHSIPSAAPGQGLTTAVSGHAYATGTKDLRPKEKVKTKGAAVSEKVDDGKFDDQEDSEEEEENLPDFLPKDFKLGKKLLKVFHRILEAPDFPTETNDASVQAPRKGQIRWAEFERAMKRIGFGVSQTAGSSVRFDPPAKTARPITFHQPHPDSILTPILLRWIGARLKRCYGWTTATFDRTEVDQDGDN
ncbi:hypothetical protein B0H11DRAFT_1802789 [Mycena galericulata]|nr:hypothetical protein B0H11DRAFT_1802789 [Mycena galericulata]